MSAHLRDGSVVWFFGDTARFSSDGTIIEFEIGTAAWASRDSPTLTRDPPVPSLTPFSPPGADFPACTQSGAVGGRWPLAAVVQRVASRDRVVVFMQNVCLGPGATAEPKGTAVGEWYYDPADPPDGQAVVVRLLNGRLFPENRFGTAAAVDHDRVVVFGCDRPTDPRRSELFGPCYAARVGWADVARAGRYEVWDGSSWRRGPRPAPISLADDGTTGWPVGPFSVAFDPRTHRWVMVYSPWPAYSNLVAVRTAARPQGPWNSAMLVRLRGCEDHHGSEIRACYGANLQSWRSRQGRLGLGYHDQQFDRSGPLRGSFVVTDVAFSVSSK